MDLKTVEDFVTRNLRPVVILVIVSAAGVLSVAGALWRRYELNTIERISIERRVLDVEKHEFELNQREKALKQARSELAKEHEQLGAISRENDAVTEKNSFRTKRC